MRASGYEMRNRDFSASSLKAHLRYDAVSGHLYRITRPDRIAGSTCNGGYRQIRVFGHLYMEHRLIWLMTFGEFPLKEIDHINGNRSDNRLSNLRLASRSDNNRNKIPAPGALKGASKRPNGRWKSQICFNRKKIHLGTFDSELEAHVAYREAAIRMFGAFARTSK